MQNRQQNSQNREICQFCEMPGHLAKTCRKMSNNRQSTFPSKNYNSSNKTYEHRDKNRNGFLRTNYQNGHQFSNNPNSNYRRNLNIQSIKCEYCKFTGHKLEDCIKSGFHQIPKSAFSINPLGCFEFRVLLFGLRNSPRTFQRVLSTVLGELLGKICFVFIDDIIIFGEAMSEANEIFNTVAQKLREVNLTLEPEKCEFLKREVCYLSHIISEHGIKSDPKKVEAVKKPLPIHWHLASSNFI